MKSKVIYRILFSADILLQFKIIFLFNSLHAMVFYMLLLSSADFFSKSTFFKRDFMNTPRL